MKYEIQLIRVGTGITFKGNAHQSFSKDKKHFDYAYEVPAGVMIVKDGSAKIIGTSNILEMEVKIVEGTEAPKASRNKSSAQEV